MRVTTVQNFKISNIYMGTVKRPMVKILKFLTPFSFCSQIKIMVLRAGIHKMLVRIANSEDPDQTSSLEAV